MATTAPMKPREMPAPLKPRASLVREVVAAQASYDRAKRRVEAAKTQRDDLLRKLIPKVELGEWITVAGWAIRVTMQRSGESFKLADYLKQHKLTAAMRAHVTPGSEYPRLWIKPDGK